MYTYSYYMHMAPPKIQAVKWRMGAGLAPPSAFQQILSNPSLLSHRQSTINGQKKQPSKVQDESHLEYGSGTKS